MSIIKTRKKCKHCGSQHYYKYHLVENGIHILRHKRNYWRVPHKFVCIECGRFYLTYTNFPFEHELYIWDEYKKKLLRKPPSRRGMRITSYGWRRM